MLLIQQNAPSDVKRICIVSKEILGQPNEKGKKTILQEGGIFLRTTRSYAKRCVEAGTHTYTSKRKLHSFINRERKLYRNEQAIRLSSNNFGKPEYLKLGDDANKVYARIASVHQIKDLNRRLVGDNSKGDHIVIAQYLS